VSRKHNTKHVSRGTSNYPARLRARGESNVSVRMEENAATRALKSGSKHDKYAAKR
jgi:hypothetical protein